MIRFMVSSLSYTITIVAVVWKYLNEPQWFAERINFHVNKDSITKELKLLPSLVFFSLGAYLFVQFQAHRFFSFEPTFDLFSQIDPFPVQMPSFLSTFFYAVLLGPLIEELGFRGFALELLERWKGALAAILINSIVFGLLHGFNIFGAALLAIVCSVVYLKTGNLFYSIFIHCLYNFCVLIFAQLFAFITTIIPNVDVLTLVEKPLLFSLIFIAISAFPLYGYFTTEVISVIQYEPVAVDEILDEREHSNSSINHNEISA